MCDSQAYYAIHNAKLDVPYAEPHIKIVLSMQRRILPDWCILLKYNVNGYFLDGREQ